MKKFASRKFLLTLVANVMGIVTMFVGETTATTIVGAAAVILVNIVYCIIEGAIDAKSVAQITEATKEIADELGASDEVVDAVGKIGDVVEDLVEDGGDSTVD